MLALVICMVAALGQHAHARGLIRDAEIETTLRFLADPILRAAGLNPSSVRIMIIDDPELNAFVAGGNNMFIHSGMLMRLDTPEKIQAVIAHEVAHIASGHLISLNSGNSNSALAIGAILTGMAALSGNTNAAAALAAGGAQIAERTRLSHSRAAEASADQGSVRYLARAGIDPQAALDTLELFRGQEVLSRAHIDPYALTHPMTSQRIQYLRNAVASARVSNVKPHPNVAYWHQRMIAKFDGFIRNPRALLRRLPKTGGNELTIYRRAIANQRMSNLKAAQKDIDQLLKMPAQGPLLSRAQRAVPALCRFQAQASAQSYRQAAKLSKNNSLILAGLGRALLAVETPASNKEALKVLEKARQNRAFPARSFTRTLPWPTPATARTVGPPSPLPSDML